MQRDVIVIGGGIAGLQCGRDLPELASILALLGMCASVPSLTALAAYPLDAPSPEWDMLYPEGSECLHLLAQDSGKRNEPRYRTLVLLARPGWSRARLDRGNELARPLLARFQSGPRLGLPGDVFAPGGGIQAAWLSGSALAQRLLHEV